MKTFFKGLLAVFVLLIVAGACFNDAKAVTTLPEVQALRGDLSQYPEYSIQLLGLREDQGKYYHQFKAVWMDPAAPADERVGFRVTDWTEINSDQYRHEKGDAGKVVLAKRATGGVDSTVVEPAALYANNAAPQNNDGIGVGDVAAYMLMAEILDEAGDALERNHKYRKYDTRYRTYPTPSTSRTTATAAPAGSSFDARVRDRMNRPGVAATPATATASKAAAPASFNDRVQSRMNKPGIASTPTTATTSKPATSASTGSFNDRVRSRMDNPGVSGGSASGSSTPSYTPPARTSRPSYSAPSYSAPSYSSPSYSSPSRSSGGSSRRSGGRRRG